MKKIKISQNLLNKITWLQEASLEAGSSSCPNFPAVTQPIMHIGKKLKLSWASSGHPLNTSLHSTVIKQYKEDKGLATELAAFE
jgi:hypothetical protein